MPATAELLVADAVKCFVPEMTYNVTYCKMQPWAALSDNTDMTENTEESYLIVGYGSATGITMV